MEDLMWLLVQPPEAREAVGFVDYDLMIGLSPRLPHDEAYMRGWNEAKEMASKFSEKGPALLQKDATVSG